MPDFMRNRHAVYRLEYQLVVMTFQNMPFINKPLEERLQEIAYRLFDQRDCSITGWQAGKNHVRIRFLAPPHIQMSVLVNNFKTVSSRYIRKEFASHLSKFDDHPQFWKRSSLLFTTGEVSEEDVRRYMEEES